MGPLPGVEVWGRIALRYWDIPLKNWDGLEDWWVLVVQRREGNQVFHKDLLSLLSMRTESGERLQLIFCYRPGKRLVLDLKQDI